MTEALATDAGGETRKVLVTGATGTLGRHVVAVLDATPRASARILSRRERSVEAPPDREWATADLASDALETALEGIDAVIHLASEKGAGDADIVGTTRLLEAARAAGVRHAVLISIIGCDRIPLPFYASKVRLEAITRESGVPWSIVRVAQFHSFVERLVAMPASLPVPAPLIADLRFQPVDEREVAEGLVDVALGAPLGDAPEVAGPEVLTLAEIAARWLAASGRPGSPIPIPLDAVLGAASAEPERAAWVAGVLEGYRAGLNTPHGARTLGRVTFAEWLRNRDRLKKEQAL